MEVLKILGKCERFNREEEIELCVKMNAGDFEARDKLFKAWAVFAVSIAHKLTHRWYGTVVCETILEEMQQAGLYGLLQSLEKFEVNKGYRLSTYSYHWIFKECWTTAWDDKTIRVPRCRAKDMPDIPSLRNIRSLSVYDCNNLNGDMSLFPKELMVEESGYEKVDQEDDLKYLDRVMSVLADREKDILIKRSEGMTLKEIGKKYGLAKERIRQIQVQAIEMLQDLLNITT